MTSMKDYFDEVMGGIEEKGENGDDSTKFEDAFQKGVCPFCGNDEFIIAIKNTQNGKQFNHFCPDCLKSWVVEFDPESEQFIGWELDLELPPEI